MKTKLTNGSRRRFTFADDNMALAHDLSALPDRARPEIDPGPAPLLLTVDDRCNLSHFAHHWMAAALPTRQPDKQSERQRTLPGASQR